VTCRVDRLRGGRALRRLGSVLGVLICSAGLSVAQAAPRQIQPNAAANTEGALRGRVSDATGQPLAGALVTVHSSEALVRDHFVLTDALGQFSVPGLGTGKYLVRVTKAAFLPAEMTGVVPAGTARALTIVLQTAIDFVTRGVRRGRLEDMKWVLRSSQSTRPVLRHSDAPDDASEGGANPADPTEPSGYLQLYSSSMEASDGPTDAVGSQFALTLPAAGGRVRLEGQYMRTPDQPRGLGATYEFSSSGRGKSSLGVNVRQGAYFNELTADTQPREIAVEYNEHVQWADDVVVHYGATVGRAEGTTSQNYMRPELGVDWLLRPWTTLRATYSRRSPSDDYDPIRGREFFERAVYIPPDQEYFSHMEVGLSQTFASGIQLSAGAFEDELGTQAFLIDSPEGARAFLIVDSTGLPTRGVRVVADRQFRGFDASLGYTYASAFGFGRRVDSPEDLRTAATRRNYHVLTARVHGRFDLTHTELTAVYRWSPGYPLAQLDPYQRFAEYNDPTLSLTIAQDLPSGGLLPARLQAVVDARNLFEPAFGSNRTVSASSPRILRGGLHFKF
jgi:Carboxypeptidase regulatory-like domain